MRPSRDVPLDKIEKQSKDQHKFTCVTWWQVYIMNIVGFKADVARLSGGEGEVPQVVGDLVLAIEVLRATTFSTSHPGDVPSNRCAL